MKNYYMIIKHTFWIAWFIAGGLFVPATSVTFLLSDMKIILAIVIGILAHILWLFPIWFLYCRTK